ncbi:hypothetical protein T05_5853 [Trichinella murrelli]|uniref:Uncharacterized protein n=1 Tax=Trichinella murrelli TaxID=144512 RepID=A0A0V0T3H2_9BILA|nr:hypothetical protein T05_5853 [Trichinella murrelli]
MHEKLVKESESHSENFYLHYPLPMLPHPPFFFAVPFLLFSRLKAVYITCAITDGKLGCSSGGKSTSITLGYSVHCYAISLAGGQLQFRSSTPSVHQMVKTKKFLDSTTINTTSL